MTGAKKHCLIISFGPVPTPKYQKIEGGGMRCWGLALGMKARGYEVTVGIHDDFPIDVSASNGISLVNWRENEQFKDLINNFDVVIMNYAMGGPMTFVVDNIHDDVTLVLDCYVPIFIEVPARDAVDMVASYSNYSHDILHYNKALKRGDYFLCANIPQKHLYMGALGALGVINPYSYKKERVLVVPFGVESETSVETPRNPYVDLGIEKTDFVLLWFGGLYPWFNIKPLLATITRLSKERDDFKFVIVGGKNPYNSHPDFVKQYDLTYSFFEKSGLIDKSVYFVDWVDFSDRINWYQNASVVISINNVGEENIYSWRTRVMDYVWGEIPMITNGGDPLSDSLITNDAAYKLEGIGEHDLYTALSRISNDKKLLHRLQQNLLKQKAGYYWEKVVIPLDNKLQLNEKPYMEEKLFTSEFKPDTIDTVERGGLQHKLRRAARLPRKLAHLVRAKGVRRSVGVITGTISNRILKSKRSNNRRYYFFSHPIDYTGAPLVLLDIVEDFKQHIHPKDIDLVYPGGEKPLVNKIHKLGIQTDKMVMGVGSRVIHAQLDIRKNDFVLLNTVAIYDNYLNYVLGLLESGRLREATWFIHEDNPALRFIDQAFAVRVKRLVKNGKINIVVPSKQTSIDYDKFFETESVSPVTLRVTVPKELEAPRKSSDFKKLKFVISGTPSDGRKGQLLAIGALSKFLSDYAARNPDQYREFELHLIAIGDDYISQQIKSIGNGLLKNRVYYYPKISKEKAMEITSECNVTICCSLNETFALFVAEGMLMGHVLLRNLSSGHDEQIIDSQNGYTIDSNDITDFSKKISLLLDKNNSNEDLLRMSIASQNIARTFSQSNYFDQLKRN